MVSADLTAEASFTRIEEEIRRFWRLHDVPEAFYVARRDGSPYLLVQQPLLAAGGSPTDQLRLQVTADLVARTLTMRGSAVERRTGWACHGLPVEVAVERSLGSDAADYDLAQFNAACRQAAAEGVEQGELLAERLGVWPAPGHAFVSLEPEAVGVVWGALWRLWEAGQLRHERRIVSVCPRCATPLSSAEAMYRSVEVESRSVWLQLPWEGEPNSYLLAWTAQPWMLAGMVALAAHPGADYVVVEPVGREGVSPARLLLVERALKQTLPGGYQLVRRLSGKALRGIRYRPPFTFSPLVGAAPRARPTGQVLLSEATPLDRGTGLWPVTPTFDIPSFTLAQSHGLPMPEVLDRWGRWHDAVTPWRGLSPLDAEPHLVEDLQARGLVFEEQVRQQSQALCPHCETPLLPLARSVWLVETGRGPWLVSRDRVWGVPLPVWVCQGCGKEVCLAGLDDLARRIGLDVEQIDPHRPAVDQWTFACERCGGPMRRVAAVVDAAFEAAVLPWSSSSRPDLAVGLGDAESGWLGNLADVAALLPAALTSDKAIAVPEREPEPAWDLRRSGSADALRWAACTGMTPDQAENEFLRPLWRLVTTPLAPPTQSGRARGGEEEAQTPGSELLDGWLRARLYQAISASTQAFDTLDPGRAAAELASFVSDMVGWYAPLRPGGGGEVLEVLSRSLAPFVPHVADAIHRQVCGRSVESVHLTAWPVPDLAWEDRVVLTHMAHIRHLALLGQSARSQAGIESDRLLRQAAVGLLAGDPEELTELGPYQELLARLLGVSKVQFVPDIATQVKWLLSLNSGQPVERDVAAVEIEAALAEMDAEGASHLASQLRTGLSIGLQVSGRAITLLPDEVCQSTQARPGWSAAADAGHLILLTVG